MEFYLTSEQINEITDLRDAGLNEQGNYSHIYKRIAEILKENGGPSDLINWFEGAEQKNRGREQ